MTCWHITISTFGARLHGDDRPTVDRAHNRFGNPFLAPDPKRRTQGERDMRVPAVRFTHEQQRFVEDALPAICEKGGWKLLTAACGPDHVHVLVDADWKHHGKDIRRWLKRWLTQALNERWAAPLRQDGMSWWCEGGSTKAVKDEHYLGNVKRYIHTQRAPRASAAPQTGRHAPSHFEHDRQVIS